MWISDIHGHLSPAAALEYFDLWCHLQVIVLSQEPDTISWRWTENGTYSASSCYNALFTGSTSSKHWRLIWKSGAPLSVKFFLYLASVNRCWTTDRLERRGLPHEPACVLCSQHDEALHHLLIGCVFSCIIWHGILSWCCPEIPVPDGTLDFLRWLSSALDTIAMEKRRGLSTIAALTAWSLWRHRNAVIFDKIAPSSASLLMVIKDDARSWAYAGAKGLSNIILVV
ncbi:uncharacterized protein [Aegilops tauschii subsp. strangulata]|uniref:uncharacterized protein n=1 Tax=Aegilops tauschii subsp. strangulata TaxID=200361 RepID=UPI003CC85BB1